MELLEAEQIHDKILNGCDVGDRTPAGRKTVAVCDTQPVSCEGLRALVNSTPDLQYVGSAESLVEGAAMLTRNVPDIVVVDKSFGIQAVLEWIAAQKTQIPVLNIIVWGVSVTEAEALRFLQAGAKGIVRKTSNVLNILACLHTVGAGSAWMSDCVFHDAEQSRIHGHSELTPREQQVLELVEQGLKNKEIGRELGIRPGTVKIHLKHIFEKTGVRGRYGLALSVIRQKGNLDPVPTP